MRSGIDLYIRDAADTSLPYRRDAFELLAEFNVDDEKAREVLPRLIEQERDDVLREAVLDIIHNP